jgi:DNA mismatch repair protein MutH
MSLGFDGRTASAAQIMKWASQMPGHSLGALVSASGLDRESSPHTKGSVGAAVEAYFGLPPDSAAEPDFRAAGMELKTVPLRPREDELAIKERVYITMIDYHSLATEHWSSATIRRKLGHILFVYYQWLPTALLNELVVTDVAEWRPGDDVTRTFEADWRAVQQLVIAGRAQDISERLGVALVAATKGPGGPPSRSQPFSPVPAAQRAWALKPAFLKGVLEQHRGRSTRVFEVTTTLEDRAFRALAGRAGRRIVDVETDLGLAPSGAKHRAARVIERLVGRDALISRADLAGAGVDLRVVQVDDSMMPYEALSFPAFRYQELIREDWEESELLSRLDRFMFVPIVGHRGLAAVGSCVIRPPIRWAPTEDELCGMAREWTMFRDEIAVGKALRLTPASRTHYLHVRPKGRTALDTDPAPHVGPVVKKCFWFNRAFVARILRSGDQPAWGR